MKVIKANSKVLIIVRGAPGSGKSFLAKQLAGPNGIILSTDDFFIDSTGKYVHNPSKLGEYHKKNYQKAVEAMQKGISPIVIDNTNTQKWEFANYVSAGKQYGYKVVIKEPDTPWKFDPEELAKRNTHGVPLDAIKRMLQRWEKDVSID